jgi:hypothetical protein
MEHLSRDFYISLSPVVLLFATKTSSTILILLFSITSTDEICIARNACINTHFHNVVIVDLPVISSIHYR